MVGLTCTALLLEATNLHTKPFVDEGHPSHNYFPAWQYAIKVPLLIMIVGLSAIFTFLSLVMIKSKKRSL